MRPSQGQYAVGQKQGKILIISRPPRCSPPLPRHRLRQNLLAVCLKDAKAFPLKAPAPLHLTETRLPGWAYRTRTGESERGRVLDLIFWCWVRSEPSGPTDDLGFFGHEV